MSVKIVAKVLVCSERQVQQWARDGVIPRAKRGQYDLIACVQGAVTHLRGQAAGRRGDSPVIDLAEQRAKLAAEQTRSAAMKNAELEGQLLREAEVVQSWTEQIATAQKRIRALPKVMVTRMPGFTKVMATEALALIDEVLNDLAGNTKPAARRRRARGGPRKKGVGPAA